MQRFHLSQNNGSVCLHSEYPNWTVGWLVGCFGFNGPFRQYFSLYRAVSQREGERRERIDKSKIVQTIPPAPTASAIGPCPTAIKIVGRPGTGSLPSTIAPPNHPPPLTGQYVLVCLKILYEYTNKILFKLTHFLFRCHRFNNLRQELFVTITSICQPASNILLYGAEYLTYTENKQIFLAVQEFLIKSKRFEIMFVYTNEIDK